MYLENVRIWLHSWVDDSVSAARCSAVGAPTFLSPAEKSTTMRPDLRQYEVARLGFRMDNCLGWVSPKPQGDLTSGASKWSSASLLISTCVPPVEISG